MRQEREKEKKEEKSRKKVKKKGTINLITINSCILLLIGRCVFILVLVLMVVVN